jgi:ABC-type nitrate/sulfonate/bicarbonate transport system substrate-binding protein
MSTNHGRRRFVQSAAIWATATLVPWRAFAEPSGTLDINIVNTSGTAQLAFETLLRRQGYFEEFGLNARTENVSDGLRIMAALIGGGADACMTSGFGQVLPGVEKGAPVRVIAGANLLATQGVLTHRDDIESIADLKGMTIGTGPLGALEHQLMVGVLMRHEVDPNSVHFVNVGNVGDIFRAISAGQIDAGPVNMEVYNHLSGNLRVIGNLWTELPDFPYLGSFASLAAITNKRETLIRTLAVYARMYRFLSSAEGKEPYIKAYVDSVGGDDARTSAEKLWQFFFDTQGYAGNLVIPDKSLNFLQDLNVRTGVQKTTLPLDAFSDMSLAREAVKRLG